jgi:hypothetical protein
MKRLILFCFVIAVGMTAFSQKNFEGTITYQMVPRENLRNKKNSKSDTMLVRVHFAPHRLLMSLSEEEGEAETEMLVLLDSGMVYRLNKAEKVYRPRELVKLPADFKLPAGTVLGQPASPLEINNWGPMGGYAQLLLADNLFFHIPEEYKLNMEFMMVRNDRIVLKGQALITSMFGMMGPRDEGKELTIVDIIATSIQPDPLPVAAFEIPANYTNEFDRPMASDTTAVMYNADSLPPPPLEMETTVDTMPVQKPVKAPVRSKPPVKKPANKPASSTKSTLRKEQ